MKILFIFCTLLLSSMTACTQGYFFTDVVNISATPVRNQGETEACWCFATTSFMESELRRMGKGTYDLSEMFIVRQKYMSQLEENSTGKEIKFSQGSLSHTFINAYRQVGIVPENIYTGINYNHSELTNDMEALTKMSIKTKKQSPQYLKLVNRLFDLYFGKLPEKFTYQGKEFTPKSFAASLELNMDDYIELTSFIHHPYYVKFDIEIPDNWEHQLMHNIPLDEIMETVDFALNSGFTVCWDGDISEKGFSFSNGIAINPEVKKEEYLSNKNRVCFKKNSEKEHLKEIFKFARPFPEIKVTPEIRQNDFKATITTDDHLMHITGITKDQNGTKYYITKNSWGVKGNKFGGYLNMSDSYVRAKTIYIMVHKNAIPKAIKLKLGIQ